jgi:hypothetical protein
MVLLRDVWICASMATKGIRGVYTFPSVCDMVSRDALGGRNWMMKSLSQYE